jgi:hypothetical protein
MTKLTFLTLLFLVGCAAQIDQKMKTAVLLSPEALGPGVFSFGIGDQSAPIIIVTDDVVNNPPDKATSRIGRQERVLLQAGLGLTNRIEFSVDPASWLNSKIQLLGEPFSRAEGGNLSLSLLGSVWSERINGHGSDLDLKSGTLTVAPDVSFNKEAFSWRGGVLLGYRLADPFLLYTGVHHQEHRYCGGFNIVNGAKGRFAGFASANSASLGLELRFGKALVIRLEDAYSLSKVPAFGVRSSQHSVGLLMAGVFGASGRQARRKK